MKIAIGNSKLGTNCLIISRPVGLTCPSSCFFLDNGCYAQETEKRFPNARLAGEQNVVVDWRDIRDLILRALKEERSIRFFERGDWGLNDRIDKRFVQQTKRGILAAIKLRNEIPYIWTYSHIYSSYLTEHLNDYITIYASVHNSDDLIKAKRAGFKRFAWCDTSKEYAVHKVGGNREASKVFNILGEKFFTCPEQRRGRSEGGVTCTGDNKTVACNLCTQSLGHVLFMSH